MRKILTIAACLISALCLGWAAAAHDEEPQAAATKAPKELKFENLMRHELEGVEGTEVIISSVAMPPNTTLPKHWHPGEEFVYLLEGTVTLWKDGKEETIGGAGAVAMVPLKQIHTAMTGEEGAVAIVFRVHEKGQPERTLVE